MTDEEAAALHGWTIEEYQEWREWLRATQPRRVAFFAQCGSCHEGIRSPMIPNYRDPEYIRGEHALAPLALRAWAAEHEAIHAYDVPEWEGKRPHRVLICAVHYQDDTWAMRDVVFDSNWFEYDRLPVLWNLGPEWTKFERAHSGPPPLPSVYR